MVLLITNKEDITVDFVVQELKHRNIPYYRLNTEDIPDVVSVIFEISKNEYCLYDHAKELSLDLHSISSVYFRRPKLSGLDYISPLGNRDNRYLRSELFFLLEGIYKTLRHAYWINDVYKIREAENKIYQMQIAQEIGFAIPYSIISNSGDAVSTMLLNHENCIIKPIKTGNVADINSPNVIFTSRMDKGYINQSKRIESFPCYIQENIEKQCDVRCIVVGDEIFAAGIDSQIVPDGKIDWRKAATILPHRRIDLPCELRKKIAIMTKELGLVYAALDFILDKSDNYVFLECNPNGQWAWIQKRLGYRISECIVDHLQTN